MADEVFRSDLQQKLDAKLNSSAITPSTRKINEQSLANNIVLKSGDFSEEITGQKMLMGQTYRVVRTI